MSRRGGPRRSATVRRKRKTPRDLSSESRGGPVTVYDQAGNVVRVEPGRGESR